MDLDSIYISEFDSNFEIPKNWSNEKSYQYGKNYLNKSPEIAEQYRGKIIPFNEEINSNVYMESSDSNEVLDERARRAMGKISLKQEGAETSGATTFLKSGYNATVDLAVKSFSQSTKVVSDITEELILNAVMTPEEKAKHEEARRIEALDWYKKQNEILNTLKLDINPYESKFWQNLGSLFPTGITAGIATVYPPVANLLLPMYGLSEMADIEQKTLEGGASIAESRRRGLAGGVATAALEKFQINALRYFVKKKSLPWLIGASAGSEGFTEGFQETASYIAEGKYNKALFWDKVNAIYDSFVFGTLGGGLFIAPSAKSMGKLLEVRENIYNEAVGVGYTPKQAKDIAITMAPTPSEIQNNVKSFLNEQANEYSKLSEEERANLEKSFRESEEIEREMPFEYNYVKADIEKQLTEAGLSEEEVGKIPSVFASQIVNSFKVAQEQGLDDTFEAYYKHIMAVRDVKVEPKDESRVDKMYSFAGERANLDKKQRTSLDEAKSLEGGLLSAEEIRQATGWFRGIDNKWRLEINDKDASINSDKIRNIGDKQGKLLGFLFEHDKLFKAYPVLKTTIVVYRSDFEQIAGASTLEDGTPYIVIGKAFKKQSDIEQKKSILHELQHLIQFKEGFAVGSTFKETKSNDLAEKIKNFNNYFNSAGEIEAKDVENRSELTDEERRLVRPDIDRAEAIVEFEDGRKVAYNADFVGDEDGKLYSKAYVSTPFPLVGEYFDADRFEGRGENASAHGWGNYALKDKYTNKVRYYNKFNKYDITYKGKDIGSKGISKPIQKYSYLLEFYGGDIEVVNKDIASSLDRINLFIEDYTKRVEEYGKNLTEEEKLEAENKAKKAKDYGSLQLSINTLFGERKTQDLYTEAVWGLNERKKAKKLYEAMAKLNPNDFEMKGTGAQYEVDVPEDEFLLDEQGNFENQSEIVKQVLEQIAKDFDIQVKGKKQVGVNFHDITGKYIYNKLTAKFDSKKQASKTLLEYGIKGIKYDGNIDGVGYVIFDGKDMPIKRRLLSQTEGDILGSYDYENKTIELFKGRNPTTLIHELAHNFFLNHLKTMESLGATKLNKPVYDFLSKVGGRNIESLNDFEKSDWENLVESYIDYINKDEAPNLLTKSLFERAKSWMISTFRIHQTDASDEIKEYFGKLIAREEEYPSVSNIKENFAEIKGILSQALKGENVTYKKLKRSDIKKLQKAIHTFIGRPGKSLRDEVIAYGGIKKDSEIAKSLGYDSKKKDRMFTNRPNAFEKEDVLIEWLSERGYITPTQEGETYADTENRWDEVMNLFYDAENVYNPEERLKQEQRETALANKQEAEGVVRELLADDKLGLKDVDDLYNLLNNVLISNSETDIIKINNEAIKYIKGQLTIAERDLNKAIKEIKKSQKDTTKEAQSILEKYISQLPLNYQNKKALMSEIKNVSDFDTLYKKIADLKPKVDGMVKKEIMNKHRTNIDNMIRTMKPKKGKNDIEHNRFFKILQGISRQTKEKAKEAYEQWESNYWDKLFEGDSEGLERETREFMEKIRKDSPENTLDIGFAELVMNQYLSYKANGAKSSYDLLAELDKNLQGIRDSAKAGEALIKDKKREKREKEVASVVEYVDSHEPVKSFVARVFKKGQKSNDFYLKNTDWYSITSGLFGKEWADKHDLLAPNVNYLNKTTLRVHEAQKEGKRIYKVKSIGDLIGKFEKDLRKEDFTLYRYEQKNDEIIEHSSPISKMQIMTIYNSLKNEKTANLYRKNYEKFDEDGNQITAQLDSLIGLLSKEDLEFADYMQKDLEKNYDELNKINIALYGIDLVKEDNYFPRTSKQFDSTYDPNAISANPYTAIVSQMKERTSFAVPIPKDIYDIYTKNVGDYNYMVEMFNKYKDVYDVINDTNVEEAIKRKYSSDIYDTLIEQMKSISIGGQRSVDSDLNKLGRRIMNNVIASKIALNLNVFIKQLVSFTNFSVGMSKVKFYKNLAYAIAHPVETVKFMNEYNYETIKGRVIGGSQTEAIARLTKDLESFKGGISAKARYDWVKFMSSFVAMGDIAPIYFAGYARFKDYLDQGIDLKTAQEKFMVDVNRTQQSSAQVGLSLAQQDKSAFARMFGAFLNAPAQYMRQINNALIHHRRNEITDEEFMDVITNYAVVQPILFTLVSNALASLWSDEDEEEEPLLFGVMTQMALSGFGGYPYLSAFLTGVSKKLEGEVWDVDVGTIPLVNVLFIDDVNRAYRKLDKKKLNTLDVVDIIQPMVEPIIPVPITAGKQYYRGINKLAKEK